MSRKNFYLLIPGIVLTITMLFGYLIVGANQNDFMPQQKEIVSDCNFKLSQYLSRIAPGQTEAQFPYKNYIDSTNTGNVSCILNDLKLLDSVTKNHNESESILATTLTTKLQDRIDTGFSVYKPDSLILLMQWAEKFQYYGEIDKNNELFFSSIFDYWLNYICTKLSNYASQKPSLKYDFKFKFLVAKCIEKRYNPSVKVTSFEKFVDNMIQSKWGHLANATWNQTSLTQKIVLVLFFVLTLYGILCIIQKHFF